MTPYEVTMPCDICGKQTTVNVYTKKPYARCFGCRIPAAIDPMLSKCVITTCDTYSAKRYRACYQHRTAMLTSACGKCAEVTTRAAWQAECKRCYCEQVVARHLDVSDCYDDVTG